MTALGLTQENKQEKVRTVTRVTDEWRGVPQVSTSRASSRDGRVEEGSRDQESS